MTIERRSFAQRVAFRAILVGTATLFAYGLAHTGDATPHEAPAGWKYPWACCAENDCKRVGSAEIREPNTVHPSYEIRATGELIQPDDKRIRQSPDGDFHLCAHQAGLDAGHTICLFVPSKGF